MNLKTKHLFYCLVFLGILSCDNKKQTIHQDKKQANILFSGNGKSENKQHLDSIRNLNVKYLLEQLDNTKGLSNSSVNSIFQDSENLLWIGTRLGGLNFFDKKNRHFSLL